MGCLLCLLFMPNSQQLLHLLGSLGWRSLSVSECFPTPYLSPLQWTRQDSELCCLVIHKPKHNLGGSCSFCQNNICFCQRIPKAIVVSFPNRISRVLLKGAWVTLPSQEQQAGTWGGHGGVCPQPSSPTPWHGPRSMLRPGLQRARPGVPAAASAMAVNWGRLGRPSARVKGGGCMGGQKAALLQDNVGPTRRPGSR